MTKLTFNKKLTRRDAIKILGAAVGASVLANLPSKWSTPELASGVLPAHAQTSSLFLTFIAGGFNSQVLTSVPQEGSTSVYEINAPLGIAGCGFDGTHWVQISQPIANIPLVLEVTSLNTVIWFTPASSPDGIYMTDSTGKVEIVLNMQYSSNIDFKWYFQNPSDGTDSRTFSLACGQLSL